METGNQMMQLRALLESNRVGVLVTADGGQPYPNLVAYAAADDLKAIVFATPVATRKYATMKANPQVAFLVDSRRNMPGDVRDAAAVTAIGRVAELAPEERRNWLQHYTQRHPELAEFAVDDASAFFRLDVHKYILVTNFQEVVELSPDP